MRRPYLLGLLLMTAASAPLHAQTVLDFDTPPFNQCWSPYQFGGFSFASGACVGSWQDNPKSNNGTPGLAYGFVPLVMTQTNGQAFRLHSLFAGISAHSDAETHDVEYVFELADGGQAVGSFTITEGLTLHAFDQHITQATFSALSDGYIAMDDISVSASPVPEPATHVLVGIGIVALLAVSRRSPSSRLIRARE